MAKCMVKFLKTNQLNRVRNDLYLGFSFPFPLRQDTLASGVLIKWTKEISYPGVVGQDVVQMLQKAFDQSQVSCKSREIFASLLALKC